MKLSAHEEEAVIFSGETPTSDARLHAIGLTCGTLEPLIAEKLRLLEPGQVLEVTADRNEAIDGIRAWVRLTGNTLMRVEVETESGHARYFVRKKTP
jgi:TusA-related sulfurtransferase